MNARIVPGLILVLLTALSGCSSAAHKTATGTVSATDTSSSTVAGALSLAKPTWPVGHFWNVKIAIDFGFGFLQESKGKFVVARADASGYFLGSDDAELSLFDQYFDQFYLGDFDANLNATVNGTNVQLFTWPLEAGQSWQTDFPVPDVSADRTPVYKAGLKVEAYSEGENMTHQLRIQGATSHGEHLDYDFDQRTGWMTYFRLINQSSGRILLSLDFRESGDGFHGPVHHTYLRPLFESVVVTPPCDQKMNCDPKFAVAPGTMVMVPAGYSWVEEVVFMFTFPLIGAGGGEVVVDVSHPDNTQQSSNHTGAGDQFQYTFHRYQVKTNIVGMWMVSAASAGTGGAFIGLYGVKDEVTSL